jgi:hypothetical protein
MLEAVRDTTNGEVEGVVGVALRRITGWAL